MSLALDCVARIWDVGSGTEVSTLPKLPGAVQSLAYSPDGAVIAVGGTLISAAYNESAILWDTVKGKQLKKMGGRNDREYCACGTSKAEITLRRIEKQRGPSDIFRNSTAGY